MLLITNKMQKNYVKRINKNVILLHVVGYQQDAEKLR